MARIAAVRPSPTACFTLQTGALLPDCACPCVLSCRRHQVKSAAGGAAATAAPGAQCFVSAARPAWRQARSGVL